MTFLQVYEHTLRRLERDPATWSGSAGQQEEVADAISYRVRECWETTMWSRLVQVVEKDVTVAEDKSKYVPFGSGVEELDAIYNVYKRNPRLHRNHGRHHFQLSPRGIELTNLAGTSVFVEYRPRAPMYTRVAYEAGITYAVDDVVYDATSGECYRSLQSANTGNAVTEADWWSVQELPDWMAEYVARASVSDLLRSDGRSDRADVEEQRAARELQRVLLVEEAQQDQHRMISVNIG